VNIETRNGIFRSAIASVAALAFAPAFAQESTAQGPVADPDTPPPYMIVGSEPSEKALSGARWQWTGWANDQTFVGFLLYSGTFSTSCTSFEVQPWTITIKRDGITFWIGTGNRWQNVDFGQRCGLNWSVSKGSQYQVLTPGTYELRMSQPAFGADLVTSFVLPPCGAAIPMYSARHDAYTDNFYSTTSSQINDAVGLGYYSTGIPFRVSLTNEKTAPWKRFFKGAPQIEHFYTHLAGEEQSIYPYGYVYERDEGNVFPTQVTGTVALLRLTRYDAATGGLEHAYTTSAGQVSSLQAQGWTPEGEKGFVCAP
jgi:uncharacterized protein DUF5648